MVEAAILVFEGCQASTAASMAEIFWLANIHVRARNREAGDLFNCRILSPGGEAVDCLGGVGLAAGGELEHAENADIIFIPGVRAADLTPMLRHVERLAGDYGPFLTEQHRRGAHLCASCSSVFVFGDAGLLDNRTATVSWWLAKAFRERYPTTNLRSDRLVTSDERIHCAGGFTACLNLGLHLVAEFGGPDLAQSCAGVLLVDANRKSQLPYATLQDEIHHKDRLVSDAQHWLRSRIATEVSVEMLAEALGTTPRTLGRRFKAAVGRTPLKYLQRLRVEQAKRVLSTTDHSIERVAGAVGYADVAGFRRVFQRETSLTPSQFRSRVRPEPAVC